MSGNLDPRTSPGTAPRAVPSRGVRRLNRVPMLAICGLMGIVIFAVIYGFHERIVSEQAKLAASQGNAPQAGSAASALQGAPSSGLIPSASVNTAPASAPVQQQQQQTRQLNPVEQAQLQAWTDYEQRKEAIDTAHYQAEVTAIGAPANVNAQGGSGLQMAQAGVTSTPNVSTSTVPAISPSAGAPAGAGNTGGGSGGGGAPGYVSYGGLFGGTTVIPPANPNANDQAGKQGFLAQSGSTGSDDYLNAGIQHPKSPCEVIAGTVIPATMIGGIDSDLPGEIIGQVRENVYDTATGKYLLIPLGSRLVGVYSSAVTYGQTRVLVAWNDPNNGDADNNVPGMPRNIKAAHALAACHCDLTRCTAGNAVWTFQTRRCVRRPVIVAVRGRARGAGRERLGSARDSVACAAAPSGEREMTRQCLCATDSYSPWRATHG